MMSNIMKMPKEFLVEIRWKDWIYVPEGQSRIIAYEHVVGCADDYYARMIGWDQFYARLMSGNDESLVKLIFERGFTKNDFCAPDAVELD